MYLTQRQLARIYTPILPLLAVLLFGVLPSCNSGARDQGSEGIVKAQTGANKSADERKDNLESMIDALANKNHAPKIAESGEVFYDKAYDWAEWDRVRAALSRVADCAEELWPKLVRYLTDDRYCITWGPSEMPLNFTIGEMCAIIIRENMTEVYGDCLPKSSERTSTDLVMSWPDILGQDNVALKAWCEQRKAKKLYELQIELCEWAIQAVPELDDLSKEEKDESIAALKAKIESLQKSQKAVKATPFKGIGVFWETPGPKRARPALQDDTSDGEDEESTETNPPEPEYLNGGEGMF